LHGVALASRPPAAVVELFQAHDVNRSGYLTASELRKALSSVGVELNAAETIKVLRSYDERPNARLDLFEFARLISDTGLLTRAGVPINVRLVFDMHDVNRSGYLDYRELRNALRSLGVAVSSPAAASLLLSYDERPDGRLDIVEFRRLCQDLQRLVGSAPAIALPPSSPPRLQTSSVRSSTSPKKSPVVKVGLAKRGPKKR